MEVLDGIVKHPVKKDYMVISVQRHVSEKLTCVIKRLVVVHEILS